MEMVDHGDAGNRQRRRRKEEEQDRRKIASLHATEEEEAEEAGHVPTRRNSIQSHRPDSQQQSGGSPTNTISIVRWM